MTVNTDSSIPHSNGRSAREPLYLRIQNHFRDEIVAGRLNVGDRLPTEFEIADRFGTSRATVQSAMSRLVHEGWIEKRPGRGTYVTASARWAVISSDEVRSFEDEAFAYGDRVTYRLLRAGRLAVSRATAEKLGVATKTSIFSFSRLRLIDGKIIGMECRYFAPGVQVEIPKEALDTHSTHNLVERFLKQRIGRMEVEIRAVSADSRISTELETRVGTALLLRQHRMFAMAGDLILYGEAYYCEPFAFRYTSHTTHRS